MRPTAFPRVSDTHPLVLASKSPRRSDLLAQARIPHRVVASGVEEASLSRNPVDLALLLAEKKAVSVSDVTDSEWILSADTIVVVADRILGKPADEGEARDMLDRLSGRTHQVITGFCVANPEGMIAHSETVITRVHFKDLSADEMAAYIATGEPEGKAGGYAIQGIGAFMVESISGSYTNVVGLPLCAVIKALVRVSALKCYPFESDDAVLTSRTG